MFKTVLFFLCSVVILVSGTADVATSSSDQIISHVTANSSSNNTIPTATVPTSNLSLSVTPILARSLANETTTTTTTTTPNPITTSTPAPAPILSPETGKWEVIGINETCIVVQMALQFNVTYIKKDHNLAYKVLNLPGPNKTSAQGTCGSLANTEQNITLIWNTTDPQTLQNNLTLHFVKNTTKNQYSLHHLELHLAPVELPDIIANYSTEFIHRSDEFTTGLKNSYRCLKTQSLNLTNADNKTTGEISVSELQLQAFRVENTSNFGFAEDCAFDTPDIVPIAVGCALAALVVIVLIAYLVGRRRSQARGYLSM